MIWDFLNNRAWWIHLVGLLFATAGPAVQLHFIQKMLFRRLAVDAHANILDVDGNHAAYLSGLLGILERTLFFGALLTGTGAFVGIWLALKAAGGWKGWSEYREILPKGRKPKPDEILPRIAGRHNYNVFLVGSGVSVLFAGVAAQGVRWATNCRTSIAWSVGAALILVSLLVTLITVCRAPWLPSETRWRHLLRWIKGRWSRLLYRGEV